MRHTNLTESDIKALVKTHFHLVDITPFARSYLQDCLKFGRTLGNQTLASVSIESGKIDTFVWRSIDMDHVYDPIRGRVARYDEPPIFKSFPAETYRWALSTTFYIYPLIKQFLAKSKKNICVFEDITITTDLTDLRNPYHSPKFITKNNEVYYFLDDPNITIEQLNDALASIAGAWSQRIFLTSIPSDMEKMKDLQEVKACQLMTMANHVQKIIVSAYDGEGEIVWHRFPSKGEITVVF
jgi:hypothetical protein